MFTQRTLPFSVSLSAIMVLEVACGGGSQPKPRSTTAFYIPDETNEEDGWVPPASEVAPTSAAPATEPTSEASEPVEQSSQFVESDKGDEEAEPAPAEPGAKSKKERKSKKRNKRNKRRK
jgi:hypothetical protein